jgi:hypothetical protein
MDSDLLTNLGDLIEAALGMIEGVIWIVIIAAGFLLNRRKQKRAPSPSTPAPGQGSTGTYRERRPIDPANQPGFGTAYAGSESVPSPYATNPPRAGGEIQAELDRRMNRSGSGSPTNANPDEPLSFGSLFDERDEPPPEQREQTKWGFDDSEWGSSFGPKRSSEPTITQG